MKTLETQRLILRAWRMDDVDDFYDYARNPNIGPRAGWKPHESLEESKTILARFIEADDTWAIVDKTSGKAIGSIGLHRSARDFADVKGRELGYVLAEEYWGKGLMTEAAQRVIRFAFEELELEVLSIRHEVSNTASKRVIDKCGFFYEGTMRREGRRYDGLLMDRSHYSMLQEEYRAKYGSK